MGALLAQTVPLSIGAAISPLVLMGALAILGGDRGRPRLVAYALGFVATATALIAIGFAVVEARKGSGGHGALGSPAADAVMGVLLIGFAALMVRPRRKADDASADAHRRRFVKPDSPLWAFAVFGAAIMAVNLSSIVLLLAVLRELARANSTAGQDLVALGVADLFTSLPATLPLAVALLGGAAMTARVEALGRWTNRNGRYILAVLFLVFGLQDVLKAIGR